MLLLIILIDILNVYHLLRAVHCLFLSFLPGMLRRRLFACVLGRQITDTTAILIINCTIMMTI